MGFITNLKKLGEKENRIYLFLLIWLLIAYAIMEITKLLSVPIIGIMVYFPLLGFTLFLFVISFFDIDIKEYSKLKILGLLIINVILVIIFAVFILIMVIVSVFSYFFFTSYFLLYGIFRTSMDTDEKLYYKRGAWLWRQIEFWGGLFLALTLLLVFLYITWTAAIIANVTEFIVTAYIAVILVIIGLAIFGLIYSFKRKFNAWLGTFFILVTIYIFYLNLKVFMQLYSGDENTSTIYITTLLLVLDLFILIYSVSCILGTQGEILAEKLPKFKTQTIFLYLIFSKAAWEYASNFPYGTLGVVQLLGFTDTSELASLLNLIAAATILGIFFFLVIIFGVHGIKTFSIEKERMKTAKKEIKIAKKTGERVDYSKKEVVDEEVEEPEAVYLFKSEPEVNEKDIETTDNETKSIETEDINDESEDTT